MANIAGGSVVWNLDIDNAKFNSGLKKASSDVKDTSDKIEKDISNSANSSADTFSSAMGRISKAAAVGFLAAGTAAAAFVTSSIKSFAEFEQVSGGAQKIFNELDFEGISKDAQGAFRTMNISATDYLKLINQVGANFASTMGDKKGYETAKQGLQAISDFATGTGANIDLLGDKFQAISRSTATYQSIADQFAGILPPTSDGFLKNAQASGLLSKSYTELTQVPIAEYQQALSAQLVQGVKDLGLQGNAAKETESTISGSFAGMKASWTNFTSALGSGDVEVAKEALSNFGITGEAFLKNVATAAGNLVDVLKNIGTQFLADNPQIATALEVLKQVATVISILLIPAMLKYIALQTLAGINALIAGAKMLAGWLMALGPIGLILAAVGAVAALIIMNWETVKEWLSGFWNWLKDLFKSGIDWIKNNWDLILAILTGPIGLAVRFIIQNWDRIKEAVGNVINWIKGGIGTIAEIGTSILKGAVNSVLGFAENTINGFIRLINGAIGAINKIPGVNIGKIGELHIPRLAEGGIVPATSGGRLAVIGEGGEDEAVIPLSKLAQMDIGGGGESQVNITLNMSGIMARSRTDLRDMGVELIEAVNEGLRAKNLPQLGGGRIMEVSTNG